MKKYIFSISLLILPLFCNAKTVSDFINEHPDIKSNPVIKSAIQTSAIGNASTDALSNGSTSEAIATDTQKLLKENGYEYAVSALRDLAVNACGEPELADVYGLKEKDCEVIVKVDSEI